MGKWARGEIFLISFGARGYGNLEGAGEAHFSNQTRTVVPLWGDALFAGVPPGRAVWPGHESLVACPEGRRWGQARVPAHAGRPQGVAPTSGAWEWGSGVAN